MILILLYFYEIIHQCFKFEHLNSNILAAVDMVPFYINILDMCTVKPVHTGMPWGQTFIPSWTSSGLERVFAFGEEQTTITCTIDMRVIIQDVLSVGLQMIGGCMQINLHCHFINVDFLAPDLK